MNKLMIFALLLLPISTIAGVGGGGVGPRPTNMMAIDIVKTLAMNDESVTFLYKAYDENSTMSQTIPISEVEPEYLNALTSSRKSKSWVSVTKK
ncbi:hypothetical protein DOM22_05640 [Bdellovibrio sp. ZAP7]|uniref:hypothetical protein n=1 Tax=Bdellovibrio sp. ZAP7 TaxID=2231053 RepID=UPI001157AFFD|nr:hypothetical protein [Bdellovibrio sp. ZAP7]QDK44679.1 hypothetical protein DOM22_05640 [Bdellovibrio sp. ZAP7]